MPKIQPVRRLTHTICTFVMLAIIVYGIAFLFLICGEEIEVGRFLEIARNIALTAGAIFTTILGWKGVSHYLHDVEVRRINDVLGMYNAFDADPDCILAMTMIDYYEREQGFVFEYLFHAHSNPVEVKFKSELFHNSLTKNYAELNEEERAVRFIIDRWLGWLERVFYCVDKGYFHPEELVFYRYWLNLLLDEKFDFLRDYAVENTCGIFTPLLEKYEKSISKEIDDWLEGIPARKFRKR